MINQNDSVPLFNPSAWITGSGKVVEKQGIFAGYQADGKKVFVGKTVDKNGKNFPATVLPSLNLSFYANDGKEVSSEVIEYLPNVEGYEWIKSSDGVAIPDAVSVSNFLVGRGVYNGNMVVGRVDLEAKKLIGTFGGKTIELPNYDVLVFRPNEHQKIEMNQSFTTTSTKHSNSQGYYSEITVEGPNFNKHISFDMQGKVQVLELELANLRNDRENYEKIIQALHKQLETMKSENSKYMTERVTYEQSISGESQKIINLETELQKVLLDNSFLLKKVSGLEQSVKQEKYQIETVTSKLHTEQKGNNQAMVLKYKKSEETLKSQQQRIYDLERQVAKNNANSDALAKKISNYEGKSDQYKSQYEAMLKKLEAANSDNEFLVKKLNLLTQSLRNYQYQLEAMSKRLQNSKEIIANAHADLAKANALISKYQAALSACYTLNGQLMTKVSGMNSMSQFQTSFDTSSSSASYDILDLDFDTSMVNISNSIGSNSGLASDTFVNFVTTTHTNSFEVENVNV